MATISINQTGRGNVQILTISNGRVIVDGRDMTPEGKTITITVDGNLESLRVDACDVVTINGNCGQAQTTSGDIDVRGAVSGSISSVSGDVHCGPVAGSISTVSGDVRPRS